jgi:carotenoid cleavage dioxygenase-like enzyme
MTMTHRLAFTDTGHVLAIAPIRDDIRVAVGMAKDWYACEARFLIPDIRKLDLGPGEMVLRLDRLTGVPPGLPSRFLVVQRQAVET